VPVDDIIEVLEVGDEVSGADRAASANLSGAIFRNDRRRVVGLFEDEPALRRHAVGSGDPWDNLDDRWMLQTIL
jgi:hypothetical protein